MEEDMISPAEIKSIAYLNKKRKFQSELHGAPFAKHVCWGQRLEYDSSSDLAAEPKKVRISIFARGGESDSESPKDSYIFHGDADSVVHVRDEALSYSKQHAYLEPSTSSASWAGTSTEMDLYSLENRSLTKSSSSKSGSLFKSKELDSLHHDYGLYPSDNYEDHLLEFGSYADCSCSEYQNDCIEHCTDKDLDDLLCSNEVSPSNYILSSGRWSVNQDAQQGSKKLTIDKEFEEYFSMLML